MFKLKKIAKKIAESQFLVSSVETLANDEERYNALSAAQGIIEDQIFQLQKLYQKTIWKSQQTKIQNSINNCKIVHNDILALKMCYNSKALELELKENKITQEEYDKAYERIIKSVKSLSGNNKKEA